MNLTPATKFCQPVSHLRLVKRPTPDPPEPAWAEWHPLLGAEVRVWREGRIEMRVCTEVTPNELWGRFDGELLPMTCVISDREYEEIIKATEDLNHGRQTV